MESKAKQRLSLVIYKLKPTLVRQFRNGVVKGQTILQSYDGQLLGICSTVTEKSVNNGPAPYKYALGVLQFPSEEKGLRYLHEERVMHRPDFLLDSMAWIINIEEPVKINSDGIVLLISENGIFQGGFMHPSINKTNTGDGDGSTNKPPSLVEQWNEKTIGNPCRMLTVTKNVQRYRALDSAPAELHVSQWESVEQAQAYVMQSDANAENQQMILGEKPDKIYFMLLKQDI
jgi:hypothetical protein